MQADEEFAQWAALFISAYSDSDAGANLNLPPPLAFGDQDYPGLTMAAAELLRSVDAGGVPAFVTAKLKQIAIDNGIAATALWTPNEIVEALRGKANSNTAANLKPTGED